MPAQEVVLNETKLRYNGFRGVTISNVILLCRQYLLCYTECSLNTSSTLLMVSKQSRLLEYLPLHIQMLRQCQSESMLTLYQVPSHLRGYRFQWVMLIFIKCFSASQNQLFHMKINKWKLTCIKMEVDQILWWQSEKYVSKSLLEG